MCVYCENFGKPDSELELNDVFIVSPAMYTQVGDGTHFIVPTNYCPNCGRRLIKDKYLNLKQGDDIYYTDKDNNEVEHGKIFSVTIKNNKVNSFTVDFDCGDFDEFSGNALGVHYFTTKKEAEVALSK